MIGIAAHAESDKLGVDFRAARPGMFQFLDDQAAGTVAQHKAVTLTVKRPARLFRLIVTRCHRPGGAKTAERQIRGGVFRTTCKHHVRIAVHHASRCYTDAVGGCRTGSDNRQVRTSHAIHDADVARCHVDDAARNEERRNLACTTGKVLVVIIFDRRQSADACAHGNADAVTVFLGHVDA